MTGTVIKKTAAQGVAEVATPWASRYLQQLCKHFAHRIPVTFDERSGHIVFSSGECRLDAEGETLKLRVTTSDPTQLENLEDVVARHLVRFAFREEMQIDWRTT